MPRWLCCGGGWRSLQFRPALLRRALVPLFAALTSCAAQSASSSDLDALRAEVRLVREENGRLTKRLERLETMQAISAASRGKVAASVSGAQPSLEVIKLKPRADAPPKIDTSKIVVEPDSDLLDRVRAQTQASDDE